MVTEPLRMEEQARASKVRFGSQVAQWILYLALSTALGLAWTGVCLLIACTFQFIGIRIFGIFEAVLPIILGASFCVGLLYRLVTLAKRGPLSDWFAALVPGIGTAFFLLFSDAGYHPSPGEESFLNRLIPTLFLTYLCGGIVLIPLSIPHTRALRWIHQWATHWAVRAKVRSTRQVLYATACVGLVVSTEMPRYLDAKAREYANYVANIYGVRIYEPAYVLSSRENVDPETYIPQQDAHFRVVGPMHWPPVEEARELTRPENARDVRERFFAISGHTVPLGSHLDQVKWHQSGGWVIVASRLRTSEAEYVEFRRF